jgi:Uma2 family endonuclease
MVMPAQAGFYTRQMVLDLPEDGNRYETVWGELLVTPAPLPRHQRILERLSQRLSPWIEQHLGGELLRAPADISWGPDILVQPDLFVVAPEQAGAASWSDITRLLLVVEVLSPSSVRADRFAKRRLYQTQAVGTYWVVDPEARTVEVWTPEARFPIIETQRVTWHPLGSGAQIEIVLAELFA